MANLAAFGAAHKSGFAYTKRREVVMQHERVFVLAGDRIDDLCVTPGTQRGGHNGLRLTAGKQR